MGMEIWLGIGSKIELWTGIRISIEIRIRMKIGTGVTVEMLIRRLGLKIRRLGDYGLKSHFCFYLV